MNLHFLVKNQELSTVCPCFIVTSVIILIFSLQITTLSQKKCAIIAAYLDLTTLETKLYEKEGQAGKQS